MSVRAKFTLTRFETSIHMELVPKEDGNGFRSEKREMRTLIFHPVYSDDPNSENKSFWKYTPSGELKLGTINQDAWSQFELGKEYYLDFTPAE